MEIGLMIPHNLVSHTETIHEKSLDCYEACTFLLVENFDLYMYITFWLNLTLCTFLFR